MIKMLHQNLFTLCDATLKDLRPLGTDMQMENPEFL
jgi:hypothetical protein